ncbi:hypothetical protein N1851_030470 [Merluccius polli]|uniref:Uncharacterized protein n=1 Tax=Merluccius polli TaxID=89951 RepID=A0AA47NQ21_MERPO|nr:hypothetical protein N1851_030470 [Merluccius polli]
MSDPKQEREATEEPPPQEIPDPHQEQRGSTGEHPWENRYENLWVEVEKREVKSTFRDVAAELKQKFGELARPSSSPDLAIPGQEPSRPEFPAVDEMSSDEEEEEGEPIMRPMAMARSAALRTIPEQRESGPEDSLSEPSTQACEAPDSDQDHDHGGGGGDDDITARDPGLLSEGPGISQRSRSPSPPPSVGSHTTDDGDSKDTLLSPVVTGPDPGSEIKPPSSEDDRWRAVDQERWSHAGLSE